MSNYATIIHKQATKIHMQLKYICNYNTIKQATKIQSSNNITYKLAAPHCARMTRSSRAVLKIRTNNITLR